MIQKDVTKLNREQLKKILSIAKSNTQIEEPNIETIDYDWQRPHQLTPTSKLILEIFSKKLSGDLSEEAVMVFDEELKIKNPFIHEHYADALRESIGEMNGNYYMTFTDNTDEIAGLIVITKVPAIQLASKILGDPTPEQPEDYQLSNLEESLLTDMCNVFIDTISKSMTSNGMAAVEDKSPLTNREWPIEVPGHESLSQLPLQIQHGDEYIEISLIMKTSLFGPMLNMKFPKETDAINKETQKVVVENMKSFPVALDVHVGKATVAMADLMNIEKGDIVTLDKEANEPFDIMIQNKKYFKAYLAKSVNRYALSLRDIVKKH